MKMLVTGGRIFRDWQFLKTALCPTCHREAELPNIGEKCDDSYLPETLYKIIGSSYEQAVEASKRLT